MLLGVGAVATKTYVDDIFSTYVYEGDGTTSHQIVNGLDLATHGGLIWGKERGNSGSHYQFDTVRGLDKRLKSNSTSPQETDTFYSSVNSNGYTINKTTSVNVDGNDYASWTFRKAPGFFDVVTYTGNGSNRTIAHSLGCVPGLIMVKRTSNTEDWIVYHKSTGNQAETGLNQTAATYTPNTGYWNSTTPTDSVFTLGTHARVNTSGETYVAYVFAGGESTNALARSVDFDGSGDYLGWAATSDFAFGTGAYTVEFWVYPDSLGNTTFFNVAATNGFAVTIKSDNVTITKYGTSNLVETSVAPPIGQWTHYALVREGTGSNQTKIYKNGILEKTGTDSTDWTVTAATGLGANAAGEGKEWDGKISNFRIVKGTAVYTSSFKPPTEPLTNITNTVLLCCNDSPTSATVTPGTITANGTPITRTDSPFDDPAGFVFGENEDQNVIKCGSYVGSGSAGLEVNLGFEPQWVMFKASDRAAEWSIVDCMRGIVTGGNDAVLYPSEADAEVASSDIIEVSATGFRLKTTNQLWNQDTKNYIFTAIRRSDGYVGKPPELGTGVFAMDVGHGTSTLPNMDSGFPVDFSLTRTPASTSWPWFTGARLTGNKYLLTYATNAEQTATDWVWDNNEGWMKGGNGNTVQSWMWKRHAGFDCICIKGDGASLRGVPHSLNKTVEMAWVKRRNSTANWHIYHKGLNGGSSPEGYRLMFTNAAEASTTTHWANTAPTSTHFFVGANAGTNNSDDDYLMMLFASVEGISSVGSYSGSSSNVSVTTGFQPRFIIIKRSNNSGQWAVFDTLRGITSSGSNGDKLLYLNASDAQYDGTYIELSSTGFTVNTGWAGINGTESEYIYYAHA